MIMWLISGYKHDFLVIKLKATTNENRLDVTIIEGPRVGYGFGSLKHSLPANSIPKSELLFSQSEIIEAVEEFLENLVLIDVDDLKIEPVKLSDI